MEIRILRGDIAQVATDGAVVNLFEGVTQPGGATGAADAALGGAISQLIASGEIKGKLNEVTIIHSLGRIPPRRMLVVGLGKREEFTLDRVRQVSATAAKALRHAGAKSITTIVHGGGIGGLEPGTAAQALVEGTVLGLYTFRRHMTKEADFGEVESLTIVERDVDKTPILERACTRGKIVAEATNLCRNMVNEPANYMTPTLMAEKAREVADAHGLELRVLERQEMQELGMGGLLGVAQGSREPPKLIILSHRGDPSSDRNLGLVGKGITFDSGGISIKPSERMEEMKGDMAGGAAVIVAMAAIAQLKLKMNVTGLVPTTENLPDGAAYKPGDVLRAMSGKTIEVISTDAEGRLILADALAYARKLGVSHLVDAATLTGACSIALGPVCTGAFTNNQELLQKVLEAAEAAGEKTWQMPMHEEYRELIKSDVADIKNVGGRAGGAITAAMFLAEFAEDTPWVHLDIAPTSFQDKDTAYAPKGATGVPVGTFVNLAQALASK
ncbi:MAG: leucyl aminopeptidase [Chloroflexi bacterium]|nr:leucyl aminopeptidase [Chloroflexota bacterium]